MYRTKPFLCKIGFHNWTDWFRSGLSWVKYCRECPTYRETSLY